MGGKRERREVDGERIERMDLWLTVEIEGGWIEEIRKEWLEEE
jgi:hypothetical protein